MPWSGRATTRPDDGDDDADDLADRPVLRGLQRVGDLGGHEVQAEEEGRRAAAGAGGHGGGEVVPVHELEPRHGGQAGGDAGGRDQQPGPAQQRGRRPAGAGVVVGPHPAERGVGEPGADLHRHERDADRHRVDAERPGAEHRRDQHLVEAVVGEVRQRAGQRPEAEPEQRSEGGRLDRRAPRRGARPPRWRGARRPTGTPRPAPAPATRSPRARRWPPPAPAPARAARVRRVTRSPRAISTLRHAMRNVFATGDSGHQPEAHHARASSTGRPAATPPPRRRPASTRAAAGGRTGASPRGAAGTDARPSFAANPTALGTPALNRLVDSSS